MPNTATSCSQRSDHAYPYEYHQSSFHLIPLHHERSREILALNDKHNAITVSIEMKFNFLFCSLLEFLIGSKFEETTETTNTRPHYKLLRFFLYLNACQTVLISVSLCCISTVIAISSIAAYKQNNVAILKGQVRVSVKSRI